MIGCCEKWDSVHLHVGRINLPLMRVFVANWPRLPLAAAGGTLAEHPTHEMSLRRILLAAVPIFQPPVFPVLTSRSWCLLIEWFDLAELDLKTYKRLLLLENLGGDEGWWWCWNWFAATVSAPVTFVTFTRLLRISRALLHKFNLVFPAFSPHFPSCLPVQMPADSDCVYRVSNGNQLFAQNIHWLNWISEF